MVRISGPDAERALVALAGKVPVSRRATLAALKSNDQVIDNALLLYFPGPNSATGEPLAELHLHGGRAVVAAVLAALSAIPGLRPAAPGEFTRRAFENGRIDLAEAEGLADLLAAETEAQRRAALSLAGGALSRRIADWQARVLALAAELEAVIDFGDEGDVGEALPPGWHARVDRIAMEMTDLLARPTVERLRDGIRVVIAGPPNAGKSSLLNALIGREAAIVTPVAGTTRDVIEAPAAIGGTAVVRVDTAGLRDSDDAIEAIGVARARDRIGSADIVLWLGDPADKPDSAILVRPKADLLAEPGQGIAVSAHTGQGVDALIETLTSCARAILPAESDVSVNRRHADLIAICRRCLTDAAAPTDAIIAAENLRAARGALDRVTGRAGLDDMLDALFGRFCVGK